MADSGIPPNRASVSNMGHCRKTKYTYNVGILTATRENVGEEHEESGGAKRKKSLPRS